MLDTESSMDFSSLESNVVCMGKKYPSGCHEAPYKCVFTS